LRFQSFLKVGVGRDFGEKGIELLIGHDSKPNGSVGESL
jgi:hypothetical protein